MNIVPMENYLYRNKKVTAVSDVKENNKVRVLWFDQNNNPELEDVSVSELKPYVAYDRLVSIAQLLATAITKGVSINEKLSEEEKCLLNLEV